MRALHVIPAVAPRYGGPSGAVLAMCAALRARGCETLLVATDADGETRLAVPLGAPVEYGGVPAVFFRRQWSEALKYSAPLARWLSRHVADFDVVHVHAVFNHACLAAGTAARRAGVPYLVRPLGTLDPWSLGQKAWKKRLFWTLAGRRLLEGAAAVHYTTRKEMELAEEGLGLSRGVVIPNGVEELFFAPCLANGAFRELTGLPPDVRYLLFLSRLHHKKGLELLLPAFGNVARALPGVALVIAGDGDAGYVASLHELAERLCPPGSVVFTGWVTGERKVDAMRGATLLALPSLQENFGLSAAEAMACGTPVLVSTEVNLADEIREAYAGWVTALEPVAIEGALREALADEDERRRRGAAGARLVEERFRWSAVARQLTALYESIAPRASKQ